MKKQKPIDVISPGSASDFCRTLKTSKRSHQNALKALQQAGVLPKVPRRWFALALEGKILQEAFATPPATARRKFRELRGKLPKGAKILPSTGRNKLEKTNR